MKVLRTGELVKIRAEALREEAERWRRQSRSSHGAVERQSSTPRSKSVEPSRWLTWLFVEPDPGYYGRRG